VRTPEITATQAMFRYLSNIWPDLAPEWKRTWEEAADLAMLDPAQVFRGANLRRWARFLPPAPAPDPDGAQPSLGGQLIDATGGVLHVDLEYTIASTVPFRGIAIHRGTDISMEPQRDNCIAVLDASTLGTYHYTDHGLAPGTYYYRFRSFTTTGTWSGASNRRFATAI